MEIFAAEWLRPEHCDAVIAYLRWLPVDPEDRKRELMRWAARAGVRLTAEDVSRVTGQRAGTI